MFLVTFWATDPIVEAVHAQPRLDFFQDFKSIFLEKVKIAQRAVFLCNGPFLGKLCNGKRLSEMTCRSRLAKVVIE